MMGCADDDGSTKPSATDTTAPAPVSDLAISSTAISSITLTWTAPGDDDTLGLAARYCLRYAATPLTEENWAAATEITTVSPPDTAGSVESVIATGLSDRTVYFFALKTADEVPNWSALSNVAADTTIAGPPPDGSWSPFGTGTYGSIWALEAYNGNLFIGGSFETAGDRPARNIARWDGLVWHPLAGGTDRQIRCFEVYDEDLVAAGLLREAGDIATRLIARWDGSAWDSLGPGLVASGHCIVLDMTVYDGRLIVGGNLSMVEGYHLASWDGATWSPFGTGAGEEVEALTVYNGELVASGKFGGGLDRLSRWDGTAWNSIESEAQGIVHDLLAYEGDLIAAGDFKGIAGIEAPLVARWDGAAWHPMGAGLEGYAAYCLEIFEGDLIVGGDFDESGDYPTSNIARWNGTDWYPMGTGTDGPIYDLTVWDGGLIAAGDFFLAGDRVANHVARWDDQK